MTLSAPTIPQDTPDFDMLSEGLRTYFDLPPPDPCMLDLLLRLARREAEAIATPIT